MEIDFTERELRTMDVLREEGSTTVREAKEGERSHRTLETETSKDG